ncbi:ferrous iron transport protein B [Caldanaerobacter sp.]|uniref:ferrous iron transport protein B n=1 Tax=Caldanaerobacter sp. TaxID=2930036 RepID=UPI003C777ABE
MRILLVGQPNVGKSLFLNTLTGTKVIVSNYPGTTVDVTEGKIKVGDEYWEFVDTPGIYSLTPSSEEEKVTYRLVLEENYDFVIHVLDALALERNLIISLQLAELGIPFMIAVNFYEEALKKGVKIDLEALQGLLGVPVVVINPFKKEIEKLKKAFDLVKRPNYSIHYDDHIEEMIKVIEKEIDYGGRLSTRGIAVKILEEGEMICKILNLRRFEHLKEQYKEVHPNVTKDIVITRAGYAFYISQKILTYKEDKPKKLNALDDFILNNPVGSVLFSIGVLSLVFLGLFYIGGWFQDTLGSLFEGYAGSLGRYLASYHPLFNVLVINAFIGLSAGISIAVPYVGLFYIFLTFMEDTGLLSRFIIALNGLMSRLNLPAKAIIPLMLGFGCSVPAIKSTRVLSNFKDRLKVAILYSVVPCSSRNAILFGLVGHYAGIGYLALIYITLFVVFLITSKILGIVVSKERLPVVEEMPPYRLPVAKNLLVKSWVRMEDFVTIVIPLLIAGGILYGILEYYNIAALVVKPFRYLTVNWLGLPENTIIPIFYGFLQKDLVISMLANAMGTYDFGSVLTKLQIFTFGLASSIQIPCMIAFGMFIKEFGFVKAAVVTLSAFIYGMLIAGIIYKVMVWI